MDIERYAGPPEVVDEQAVEAELDGYMRGWSVADLGDAPGWRITSIGAADWAMRKIAASRTIEQQYRDEASLWTDAAKRAAKVVSWFEAKLREWALAERTDDRKSFPLAHGTVTTRSNPARIEVVDEDAAIEWAKGHATSAVHVKESFKVSESGAVIGTVTYGYEIIDTETGDMRTIDLERDLGTEPGSEEARTFLAGIGPGAGYVVNMLTRPAVLTRDGRPFPGLAVKAGTTTATVAPLGL